MKIIILEGDTNTGKTTTMGVVFVALHMNGGKVNSFIPIQTSSGGMDFEAVLDYPNPTCEGKTQKVAIYSKGDNIADCNDAIQKYSQHSPTIDVLIIAYSTKQTRLTIPQNDTQVYVQKTVAPPAISEVKANLKDCHKIISLI